MTFRFPLPGTKEDWIVTQEYQRIDQGGKTNHYGIDWSAYDSLAIKDPYTYYVIEE